MKYNLLGETKILKQYKRLKICFQKNVQNVKRECVEKAGSN